MQRLLIFFFALLPSVAEAQLYTGVTEKFEQVVGGMRADVKFTTDGMARRFVVFTPEGAEGPMPVVFMLHGSSGTGEQFYNISKWVEKARQEKIVAVFPSAMVYCFKETGKPVAVNSKWADGWYEAGRRAMCTDAEIAKLKPARRARIETKTVPNDVAYFDAMVGYLKAKQPIDPARMFVTGFSNGGNMSLRLSLTRGKVFKAFAGNGGGKVSFPKETDFPAKLDIFVGNKDDRFMGFAGMAYPVDETVLKSPFIASWIEADTAAHKLDKTVFTKIPGVVNGKKTFTVKHEKSLVGANNYFTFTMLQDVAHVYPNGKNSPIVMADILWEKWKDMK